MIWRIAVLLMLTADVARADGIPFSEGPCADVEDCQKACKSSAAACMWAGHMIRRAGGPETKLTAAPWYEKGCAKGDGEACWYAGVSIDPGANAKDEAARRKVRTFYDRACTRQIVRGCESLARLDGAAGDGKAIKAAAAATARAIAILKKRCAKKDKAACDQIATVTATPPAPDACNKDSQPALDEDKAAAAANEKRFAAALASRKLDLVTLTPRKWRAQDVAHPVAWKLDTVTTLKDVRVIVGTDTSPKCGGGVPAASEYVRSGTKIYRVNREPSTTSTKNFTVCSCPPMCGGMRPPIEHTGYELPANTTFEGPISVPYDVEQVFITYKGQCQPPP